VLTQASDATPDPARAPLPRLATAKIRVGMRHATGGSEDKMKNYLDGGEAILEAFRKLKNRLHHVLPRLGMVAHLGGAGAPKARQQTRPAFVESWHESSRSTWPPATR